MTVAPDDYGFSTTVEALRLREWQLGPGQPTLLTDLTRLSPVLRHRDAG